MALVRQRNLHESVNLHKSVNLHEAELTKTHHIVLVPRSRALEPGCVDACSLATSAVLLGAA